MNKIKIKVSDWETFLPEKVLSNFDLMETLDTTNEWIVERTGIEKRHLVEEGEYASDLATKAALKTIESANINPLDIDAIIIATTTSEKRCPSCAVKVQSNIGAKNAFAFDLQAACSGFIYSLTVAESLIKAGKANNILLIGADTLSLFSDWTDRSTCVLFGDGAGSCLVRKSDDQDQSGIISTKLYADGDKHDLIIIENSEKNDHRGHLTMSGKAVFKYAIEYMYRSMEEILNENNMTFDSIDWIVPHQANKRILESLSKMKNIPIEKIIITIQNHANTSAASIPLALKDSIDSGKIKKGDIVLFTALGAGLTYGSALIKI